MPTSRANPSRPGFLIAQSVKVAYGLRRIVLSYRALRESSHKLFLPGLPRRKSLNRTCQYWLDRHRARLHKSLSSPRHGRSSTRGVSHRQTVLESIPVFAAKAGIVPDLKVRVHSSSAGHNRRLKIYRGPGSNAGIARILPDRSAIQIATKKVMSH